MSNEEKFKGLKQQMIQENEEKYGDELRQSYGDERIEAANKKFIV